MRAAYGHFRKHFWEVYDVRRQMFASPFDREWWTQLFFNPFIRFCLSHKIVRNTTVDPGAVSNFVRRPADEWCFRSTIDWSQGYPRSRV